MVSKLSMDVVPVTTEPFLATVFGVLKASRVNPQSPTDFATISHHSNKMCVARSQDRAVMVTPFGHKS